MKLNRNRLAWTIATLTFLSGGAVTLLGASTVQSAQDETTTAKEGAAPEAASPAMAAPKKEVITTSAANSA